MPPRSARHESAPRRLGQPPTQVPGHGLIPAPPPLPAGLPSARAPLAPQPCAWRRGRRRPAARGSRLRAWRSAAGHAALARDGAAPPTPSRGRGGGRRQPRPPGCIGASCRRRSARRWPDTPRQGPLAVWQPGGGDRAAERAPDAPQGGPDAAGWWRGRARRSADAASSTAAGTRSDARPTDAGRPAGASSPEGTRSTPSDEGAGRGAPADHGRFGRACRCGRRRLARTGNAGLIRPVARCGPGRDGDARPCRGRPRGWPSPGPGSGSGIRGRCRPPSPPAG